MSQNFSLWTALASLVLLAPLVSGSCEAETSKTRPALHVLVFNYSSASTVVLIKATVETSQIFAREGIDFAWTYCPSSPSPDSPPACEIAPDPGDIRLRVLGHHLNNAFQDSIFGFAIAPTFATVYYDPARLLVETASDSDSYLPVVLGYLIAHEIGHLLLGDNRHTMNGIMQARWNIQQMQQLMKGTLQFTPQQVMRMRIDSGIRTR